MSDSVAALVVGTILAVLALAYVLYPLFFSVADRPRRAVRASTSADDSAIRALREIEFDRATGKLSDDDYAALRKSYGAQAVRELRLADDSTSREPDPIEARIRAYREGRRECASCGLRPEPDAIYCSTCGAYLNRTCPACDAPVAETGAAFCSGCGTTLAARGVAFV